MDLQKIMEVPSFKSIQLEVTKIRCTVFMYVHMPFSDPVYPRNNILKFVYRVYKHTVHNLQQ